MKKPFLSPRNDLVFKRLFGDPRDTSLLTGFLQAILDLPAGEYEEVRVIDPYLAADFPGDKESVLDVKVKTTTGKVIDVEIQVVEQPQMRERVVFYLARMVTEQIGKGDDYGEIKRSISILITDYVQIPENRSYHNRYVLHDRETDSVFTDLMEINTLELPKLPLGEDGTEEWEWMKFLNARKEEELTMLAEKNPLIGKAVSRLVELSQDERTRLLAESREKMRRDIAAREQGAANKGRVEGRVEAQLAIARKALSKNMSIEDIMDLTGLSAEEIQSLRLH
ncbi:MAG: Rpn family recombination-promoting nuclease/putative transposase [Zoogloeaceae bacterium]|jgi:predicted transposase/invertase (TIGR01784 family)|nr:Rpn family recombination-promoting nuclease/putative transposase [Zoogloeaceae bacterium]